jgi:hypothetical protein
MRNIDNNFEHPRKRVFENRTYIYGTRIYGAERGDLMIFLVNTFMNFRHIVSKQGLKKSTSYEKGKEARHIFRFIVTYNDKYNIWIHRKDNSVLMCRRIMVP